MKSAWIALSHFLLTYITLSLYTLGLFTYNITTKKNTKKKIYNTAAAAAANEDDVAAVASLLSTFFSYFPLKTQLYLVSSSFPKNKKIQYYFWLFNREWREKNTKKLSKFIPFFTEKNQ